MQITVKSTKVGAEGTSKHGVWKLIVIKTEDDKDYITFHQSALALAPGTVISIDELIIKDGKEQIKEYTVISAPEPRGSDISSESRNGMTPEMWAEKDRLERFSRECNTCFMGIMELAKSPPPDDENFKEVYNAALVWALAHFNPTSTPKPATKPVVAKQAAEDRPSLHSLIFADAGKLKTACISSLKMSFSQMEKETAEFDLTTEKGRKDAWNSILAIYEKNPDPDHLFG